MNKLKKIVAALALAMAGLTVSATGASAAASDCPANTLCFFADINYGGTVYLATGSTGTWYNVGSFNDQMSSWINNSTHDALWSVDANGGGSTYCLNSGSHNAQVISSRNDLLSAYYIYLSNAIC